MDTVLGLLGLAAIAGGGWYVYKTFIKDNDEGTEEVATASAPVQDKTDVVLNALVKFNITLRDNVSDQGVVEATERVIDLIKEVVEPVNTQHVTGMTPVVNRTVERYLPSLIGPYIKLSAEGQAQNADTVINKLETLENELEKVKAALENKNTAEFDKQAELISALFTDATDNL